MPYTNGFLLSDTGQLLISDDETITHYKNGLPFDAEDKMVTLSDQSAATGDSFISGIRVSVAGGVCITDVSE